MTHHGSCLCGQITYQIHGELTDVLNCHCSMCRKLHASGISHAGKSHGEGLGHAERGAADHVL